MAGFNAFLKNNNIITGTAIPTEGNFKTGDIIVNVGPNSATEPMWICNEGGNPGIWGPVGVGSGSIVSINSSVLINEPTNEVPLDSLGVGVSSKDKLLVHYNSTHLLEGVNFEISKDGSKIIKLGEGSWNEEGLENCIFALELFKGVESIDGDKIVVDSKMTCKTNHVIIENACSEVEIGIEGFNAGNDMMLVFKNGVNMVEGVDYEVQDGKIVSTGEVWNENGIEDYGMTFVVFKEVVEYNGDAEVKAENIADGSIGMDKLGEDVREAIEAASNIDLSGYQSKEDEELVTNNKTVIGAINELFQSANNGKELIANAIGEPLDSSDTFSAMSNDINGLLSTFKTNMMNNGVTVESGDKFKALIDKIATMVEEGSGKGIQFASGTIQDFGIMRGTLRINVDIGFNPTYVFIFSENYMTNKSGFGTIISNVGTSALYSSSSNPDYRVIIDSADSTGLTIAKTDTQSASATFYTNTYYAIGVGEEDTTLRDSLASILQEEGVDVTEEDDMSSLISKVDEEFTKDNNTISNLTNELAGKVTPAGTATAGNVLSGQTFINSTGQLVTGTMANRGGAQTVTPGTSNKTLNAGYYSGNITVAGDADLVAANIVSGKNIFGVAGSAPRVYYGAVSGNISMSIPADNNNYGDTTYERTNSFSINFGFTPTRVILIIPSLSITEKYTTNTNNYTYAYNLYNSTSFKPSGWTTLTISSVSSTGITVKGSHNYSAALTISSSGTMYVLATS